MIYQSLMWGVYHHNLDIPGGDGPVPLLPHNLVVVEVANLANQHHLASLQIKIKSLKCLSVLCVLLLWILK